MKNAIIRSLLAIGFILYAFSLEAKVYYVTPEGADVKDGKSWETASNDLQAMINASIENDQVWVASGTYALANGTSFMMKEGVNIYGGFTGTETTLGERDWEANISILKGNNSSVVIYDNIQKGVLDGFIIRDGYAFASGGGIHIVSSSPVLNNLIVTENESWGGGVFPGRGGGINIKESSTPVLNNVVVSHNEASYEGGGMYISNSFASLHDVAIEDNTCDPYGGGLYIDRCNAIEIDNLLVRRNSTPRRGGQGGGIYIIKSDISISNITLEENSSPEGGGIYIVAANVRLKKLNINNNFCPTDYLIQEGGGIGILDSEVSVEDAVFTGNKALRGGAICVIRGTNLNLDNTTFIENKTLRIDNDYRVYGGSAIYFKSYDEKLTVNNSTFHRNISDGAGALYCESNEIQMNNCKFTENKAPYGGALYLYGIQSGILKNIETKANEARTIAGSIFMSSCSITMDSLIVSDSKAELGGGLYFAGGGNPVIRNSTIRNCLASQDGGGIYVYHDPNAAYGETFMRFQNLLISDNEAIGNGGGICNKMAYETEIWLENSVISNNKAVNGGGIYDEDYAFSDFTISNTTVSDNTATQNGGGIYKIEGKVSGCVIKNNTAAGNGGGLYLTNVTLENDTIQSNTATNGGGICQAFSSYYQQNIYNTIVSGNIATNDGGGILTENSSYPVLNNVLITGNKAGRFGGGFCDNGYELYMTNVTISGNNAAVAGSGLYFGNLDVKYVRNTIVKGNGQNEYTTITYEMFGYEALEHTFSHSLVANSFPVGKGNIDDSNGNVDVRFVNPVSYTLAPTTAGDYRLLPTSSLIDKGNNTYLSDSTRYLDLAGWQFVNNVNTHDLDGNLRVYNNNKVDLGVYEFQGNALSIKSTEKESPVTLSYNTAKKELHIQSAMVVKEVEIISIDGKTVIHTTEGFVNLQNCIPGIYIVKVTTNAGDYLQKIIR